MKADVLSPGRKAQRTAKWARIMTKWFISFNRRAGARWNLVEFGGATKSESRGIVDLLAVRKNHRADISGLKRGDILEMVLIQTKGGSAPRPTSDDIVRLRKVAKHHKAVAIVLAEWSKGTRLELYKLQRNEWVSVRPVEVFG